MTTAIVLLRNWRRWDLETYGDSPLLDLAREIAADMICEHYTDALLANTGYGLRRQDLAGFAILSRHRLGGHIPGASYGTIRN